MVKLGFFVTVKLRF